MAATGQVEGKARRAVYNSGAAGDATWNTNPGMASWVLVEGVGSTVLVDESGASVTIVTDALMPNKSLPGPWQAFTSTTSARVTMGNGGRPPVAAIPASAVPATTAAVGGVALSVAPLVAATPIAAGSNDPRITTREVVIPLSGTDGTLAEREIWRAPVACTITGWFIACNTTMAASNTNYLTFTGAKRPLSAPASPATQASSDTRAANLNGLTAWTEASLGTVSNAALVAGDIITIASVKTSAGVAGGDGWVRVTYSVP